jgi:hypothetical protein
MDGVLRDTPGDLLALNDLAWLRATSAEPSYRDTSVALALSQRALELGGAADAGVLDTRAAAEASAGRFMQASATSERAIALARASGEDSLARQVATRLAGYREGRAFVQPRPAHRP